MGTGASAQPAAGVPANPRVVYNEEQAKKEKKAFVLDTPVLVDVQHGSIRYRYSQHDGEPRNKSKRIERPYEGKDATGKIDYFYHARLKDFSTKADKKKEDSFKFLYVQQGPRKAQSKKLYYVYGRGWDAKDGLQVKPSQTKEAMPDYAWPSELRVPNDLYYNLTFCKQDADLENTEIQEDRLVADLESSPGASKICLILSDTDTVSTVKAKLAIKLLKAASNIHICHNKQELSATDVIADIRSADDIQWKAFEVELSLI